MIEKSEYRNHGKEKAKRLTWPGITRTSNSLRFKCMVYMTKEKDGEVKKKKKIKWKKKKTK